ncbi:MAG: hypothetical protein AAF611_18470 [Bacteroidota bacterium]
MKKIIVFVLALFAISCLSDDENLSETAENSISFTLNGVDYLLTDYEVRIDPTNADMRIVEASFDHHTKQISFFVIVEETNEIEQFILEENDFSWISEFGLGYRETSITTHTNTNMIGTFTIIMEGRSGEPAHVFTNGIINISY